MGLNYPYTNQIRDFKMDTTERKFMPREKAAELMNDEAFALSVRTRDITNMQIVLRAYGYVFTVEAAEYAIWFGEQVK
ncbi:hypothetical protein D3C72_1733830 [compost metagenome]